jgi:hypothetical protein
MSPPGIYTSNGQTMTYYQPAESLGPITTVPYTPVVPASSNCVTYQSAQLYSGQPAGTPVASSTPTAKPTGSTGNGGSGSGTRTGSAGAPSPTTNGASAMGVSTVAGLAGVLFAMAFLS